MKNLSRWASRHLPIAITLIIFCEVINGFNGVLLGANALTGWSGELLLSLTILLVALAIWVRFRAASLTPNRTYAEDRWLLAGAFGSNFLLFIILGALWGQQAERPSSTRAVYGSRRVVTRADTTLKPTQPAEGRIAAFASASLSRKSADDDRQTGKRIGYVALFLLGLVLTFYSVGLACGIACSGYGFLALVTLAFGLGFTAGGIFFLGRATDKPLKPMRELTQPERRRAVRRFWLSWLLLIGAVALALGLAAIF